MFLPRYLDLQRLGVVAGALADLAEHLHVRHELQVGRDDALPAAVLAAAALDVEAEPRGRVAARLGLGRGGEELPDLVVDADVGGGVGARRAPDRRLVDVDDIVEVLDPLDAVVLAGEHAAVVEERVELLVEDLVDQRALAGARGAGDADEGARAGRRRQRS